VFERIAALAGRAVKRRSIPAWLAGAAGAALAVVHPRMGQFARFAALLATHDVIAPALGTTTFARYLAAPGRLEERWRATCDPMAS
nr:hypothetical protein [Myxococcota bacterium]